MLIKIQEHFQFVRIDEFVIMPGHIHAIIIINDFQKTPNAIAQNGDVFFYDENSKNYRELILSDVYQRYPKSLNEANF